VRERETSLGLEGKEIREVGREIREVGRERSSEGSARCIVRYHIQPSN
jgi:hypothetical protein